MNPKLYIVLGLVLGALLGAGITWFAAPSSPSVGEESGEKEPLYWVAPMDPNFRRDGPGKSPMGMDLVPVYAEDESTGDSDGVVKITPQVVNQLGVRTADVVRETLNDTLLTVGEVAYAQDEIVSVHPRTQGWVEDVAVREKGERVIEGEPLYRLYSPELLNAQEEYLVAQRRNDKRLLNAAKIRLQALAVADAEIKKLAESGEVLQDITYYAPATGVVLSINVQPGAFVTPGSTMMTIASLEDVWLDAHIFESDAPLVEAGQHATVEVEAYPSRQWHGMVDYVYPEVDPVSRTIRARLKLANPNELLLPGMFATVAIDAQQTDALLSVPTQALIQTGRQQRVVLALGDGRFKSVQVEAGREAGDRTVILSGVEAGDTVVTSAQFLLDSESHQGAEFNRIDESAPMEHEHDHGQATGAPAVAATIEGVINSIDEEGRTLNISHEAIEELGHPAMTMNFAVAEDVDITSLHPEMNVKFDINDDFEIVTIHPQSAESNEHNHHEGH